MGGIEFKMESGADYGEGGVSERESWIASNGIIEVSAGFEEMSGGTGGKTSTAQEFGLSHGVLAVTRASAGVGDSFGGWEMERLNDMDRADEAVAFADDSFEETRALGIVAESETNFADDAVGILFGVDEEIGGPESGEDFLAGDELTAAADEKDQQVHGFFGELHATAVAAEFVAAEIQFDFGGVVEGGVLAGRHVAWLS
jgi:hypothetical protein